MKMREFTIHVATDKVGSECTKTIKIEEEELEGLSEEEVINYMYDEYAREIVYDMMEYWVTEND